MNEETQAGEARSTPDTEERPRTEAGRALLASLLDAIHIEWGSDPEGDDILLREILAIEAEAATPQQAERGLRRRWDDDRDGIEWRLRAAAPQPAEQQRRERVEAAARAFLYEGDLTEAEANAIPDDEWSEAALALRAALVTDASEGEAT